MDDLFFIWLFIKFCMHYINGQTVYASVSDGLAMNDLCWLDMAHFPALCIALDYMWTLNTQNSHAGQ